MFRHRSFDNHEQVIFGYDRRSGLRAIIAIHNTNLGPGLGGCRVWTYDTDDAALDDVLRLSRGMTYKTALAELPLGGGKSVVIVDRRDAKTPAMFEALGRLIEQLGGRYIAAEDVGSSPDDMLSVRSETRHVTGIDPAHGGAGDPSPMTAYGCLLGVKAAVAHALGRNRLDGVHVAIQGLGGVGFGLAAHLAEAGAKLTVTDIDAGAIARAKDELGAEVVDPEAIYDVTADVFSPNALGATLNATTIPRLKVRVVAGAANNQLATEEDGATLRERGILYAPDYAINAGGITHVCGEYLGWAKEDVRTRVEKIGPRLADVFKQADAEDLPPGVVADRLAEARFQVAAQ